MKSLSILLAFYVAFCHAAAIQSYGQARDVTPDTPTRPSQADPNPMVSALGLGSILSTTLTSNHGTSADTATAPIKTQPDPTTTFAPPPITTSSRSSTQLTNPSPSSSSPPLSAPTPDPNTICNNVTANPDQANYTQPYTCTPKPGADYAILGMYYDVCTILSPPTPQNSSSTQPTSHPDTLLCCDPTYSQPSTFDTLCIWGGATNISVSDLPPDFDPRNITRPKGAAGAGRCMVSPVLRPRARCVQVMVPEEES